MSSTLTLCHVLFYAEVAVTTTDSDSTWVETYRMGTSLLPGWSLALADGSGPGLAHVHLHKAVTLAGGASATLDLNAFASEAFGTIDLSTVSFLMVRVRDHAPGQKVTVGGAAVAPWAPWLSDQTVTWDVHDLWYADWPDNPQAVPGGGANLKILNPGGSSLTVDVSIVGN